MRRRLTFRWMAAAAAGFVSLSTSHVLGLSHTWRIAEIYSNADGTVQFIELLETCGSPGETVLSGHQVTSTTNSVNLVSLPANSSTSKRILLGTANLTSFGGPAPDYVIPANFFSLTGDTIQYTPYHTCVFSSGAIPTDGVNSLHRPAGCSGSTCLTITDTNSPTNFAGETGTVAIGPDCSGVNDCSGNGECIAVDTCQCDSGWTGADCSTFTCVDVNDCSGHGTCDGANLCTCDEGYVGLNCATLVPTVSQWGLTAMSLMFLAAASLVIRRRAAW